MTKNEIIGHLREHEAEFRAEGLASLYLFGSAARGDTRAESDIDLMFELGDAPFFSLLTHAKMQLRAEELLGRPVDLVPRAGLRPGMAKRIERELVRIF